MNNVDTPGVSPEMEVLLWSIRVDGQGDDRLPKLLKAVDKEELYRLAQAHQLTAFLYHRLKTTIGSDTLSHDDLPFRNAYLSNIRWNLAYTRQLITILNEFSRRRITVIPFKGIVLAHQAYSLPDVRRCGDIDILIRKTDLPDAIELLQEMGMYPRRPFSGNLASPLIHSIMRSESFHAPRHADVDVHWAISDVFSGYSAERDFFRNYRYIPVFGFDIPTLSLEDTLIMLAAHGMKHFWHGLKPIADVIFLISNNPEIDLLSVLETAEQRGCRRLLAIALHLAQMMGGTRYSPPVQMMIGQDVRSYRIARDICGMISRNESPHPPRRLIAMMRARERWTDALGFGLYALFSWPPPERLKIRFPRPLRPFYIIIFAFRFILKKISFHGSMKTPGENKPDKSNRSGRNG